MAPVIKKHPDKWEIQIDIGIGRDTVEVSEGYFTSHDIGDRVQVEYVVGRISSRIFIRQIVG
jgi:hypothetical protein